MSRTSAGVEICTVPSPQNLFQFIGGRALVRPILDDARR